MRILLLLFILLLTGCASTPTVSQGTKTMQGIFGVVGLDDSQSGHFTWIQNGNDFTLELYGPLGLGATELVGENGEYTLKTSDGKTYAADSPEDLLDDVLGWSMPVSGFPYWLWGQSEPGKSYLQSGDILNQEGWQITYTYDQGILKKINMIREGVRVTIIVDHTPD